LLSGVRPDTITNFIWDFGTLDVGDAWDWARPADDDENDDGSAWTMHEIGWSWLLEGKVSGLRAQANIYITYYAKSTSLLTTVRTGVHSYARNAPWLLERQLVPQTSARPQRTQSEGVSGLGRYSTVLYSSVSDRPGGCHSRRCSWHTS